jgi:hypothetical protein
MGEVRVDADALQVGVAIGQAGQRPARRDPLQRGQAVRIELDAVAGGEIDLPQRVDRRVGHPAAGERVLQGELALGGEVVRQVEPFGGDPGAQLAHRGDRPRLRHLGMVLPQPGIHRLVGAFQGRQHRPQGVVQVQRQREYRRHAVLRAC